MGITIPSELDYALELLGYEWPNIDEDAVRDLATLLRGLAEDLTGTLDALDRRISVDLAEAFRCRAATSYIQAFTDNRTQNMDRIVDLLAEAADGIDVFADAVVALKVKVVAELAITTAQLAAAAATAVVTGGASLAANAAILLARKKALEVVTEMAVDHVTGQLVGMVIEPLTVTLAGFARASIDAPFTTAAGGEPPAFEVSFDLLEQLADAIDDCGAEQRDLVDTFLCRAHALPIVAA